MKYFSFDIINNVYLKVYPLIPMILFYPEKCIVLLLQDTTPDIYYLASSQAATLHHSHCNHYTPTS